MKTLRIKDICDKGSSNLKQKDVENQNGVYPVFGASGLIGKIDTYHQNKDYIAIVKDGSGIGRVTFMPAFSSVIGTLQYILPKEGFNIKYISYCLQSLDLAHYKQGAAIPHIYFRDYGEYEVNVEENPDDQQRIVSYLDAEFAKIEALKANAEKQLQAAKDLFQAALKELLTPKEGWVEKKLGDCLSKLSDGSHNPPKGVDVSPYKMLSSRNVGNNCLQDLENVRYLSEKDFIIENRRTNAKPYDVLLTIVGTIGRCTTLKEDDLPITFQRSVAVMTPQSNLNSFFLMYYLLCNNSTLEKEAQGAAQKGIYLNQIKNLTIAYPCIGEQQRIADRLDALSANVKALQTNYTETITLCNDLKQALLKKVFEEDG